jgi:hypothetical protein
MRSAYTSHGGNPAFPIAEGHGAHGVGAAGAAHGVCVGHWVGGAHGVGAAGAAH